MGEAEQKGHVNGIPPPPPPFFIWGAGQPLCNLQTDSPQEVQRHGLGKGQNRKKSSVQN